MDPLDECSVLLPSATLEDFPVGGSEGDARSLLAGWTVLWHPKLIAATGQIPTWYRADAPPNPDGPRVIVVPNPSLEQLPSDFRRKCDTNSTCLWIQGDSRADMLEALELSRSQDAFQPLQVGGRTIAVEDFFAAGYLTLQVQIMTRRLRYTSNLDELYLQGRMTEAAKAFIDRDAEKAAEGLHDVFDCLSEERDHYFSSDPHLIDLTLLTPSVLETAIASGWLQRLETSSAQDIDGDGVLGTPRNVLIDGEVAAAIEKVTAGSVTAGSTTAGSTTDNSSFAEGCKQLRQLIDSETIGWAGGGSFARQVQAAGPGQSAGPGQNESPEILDALTMASARRAFEEGTRLCESAIGKRPAVYAQLSGMTPVDLVPALASLGYRGVIPIDFTEGTGFGEESKVIVSAGGSEIEALTAKPIDAASDREFLSLGARLGEAIDGGEIATALLVHWPDRVCDSFYDMCRAATWSVAFGKFWSLDRYFVDGERPYHSGSLNALSKHAGDKIAASISKSDHGRSLQSLADTFRKTVCRETDSAAAALLTLAIPRLADETTTDEDQAVSRASSPPPETVCQLVGAKLAGRPTETPTELLCFNPHAGSIRAQSTLRGAPPNRSYLYAASKSDDGGCDVTFDVPALGFTRLRATDSSPAGVSWFRRLIGGRKGIAEDTVLRNQFMAVSLDNQSGGIAGVFSAVRGNRLSMRLIAAPGLAGNDDGGTMVVDSIRRVTSNTATGVLESTGKLLDADGTPIATFNLRYQLQRGSRCLDLIGSVKLLAGADADSAEAFWRNYLAIRTAVASDAVIMRPIVRDKVHTSSARQLVAPLGVVLDEAEKQTLVTGHGLPLHRRVGDRFLDTLIIDARNPAGVQPDEATEFKISFAFDSPSPVALSRSQIAPPVMLPIDSGEQVNEAVDAKTNQAWLVHVSSKDILVTEMETKRRSDGKLAMQMQLVQTRPKTSNARLQFCSFAVAAFVADESGIDRVLEELPEEVKCDDGVVELVIPSHQAVDLVVVFDV